jgi:hypothetical protein
MKRTDRSSAEILKGFSMSRPHWSDIQLSKALGLTLLDLQNIRGGARELTLDEKSATHEDSDFRLIGGRA